MAITTIIVLACLAGLAIADHLSRTAWYQHLRRDSTMTSAAEFQARLDSLGDDDMSAAIDNILSDEDLAGFTIISEQDIDTLSEDIDNTEADELLAEFFYGDSAAYAAAEERYYEELASYEDDRTSSLYYF